MPQTAAATKPVGTSAEGSTKKQKPVFKKLSEVKLQKFRTLLNEKLEETKEITSFVLAEIGVESDTHSSTVYGIHSEAGDLGDRQNTNAINLNRMHQHNNNNPIDKALKRIESGTYGLCGQCGGNISEGRLEALPATEICDDCSGAKKKG
jgi:DnaK suppressor protein